MTIQEIKDEVSSIKKSSEELAMVLGQSNINLAKNASVISNLVMGSNTGKDATFALLAATKSLSDATSSIRQLDHACDNCISALSK